MRESKNVSEMMQRVQAVEAQVAEKIRSLFGARPQEPEVSEKTDAIRAKSGDLTKKLIKNSETAWTGIKDELHRDLHALESDFNHWVEYLDKHYKD